MPTQSPCTTPFDRSLVAYALASGAVASSASGAVVYSGTQNLSLSAGTGTANSLAIDVNGGGTDFTLSFLAHDSVGSAPGRLDIVSSGTSASLASAASKSVAAALSANDSISSSPAPNGWGSTNQSKVMTEFDASNGAALAGDWGNTTKYIGGRIETTPGSNQFNYGWIRISTPGFDTGSVIVHDLAYETTVNQSILAGQTVSAVPGGGAMALFSLGASGLGRWRRRKRIA